VTVSRAGSAASRPCLYYPALRPSEAVMLREADLNLPRKGWGRIVLAAPASRGGTA
jgi:hypothetical protein